MADPDGFDTLVDVLWRSWGTLGVNSWHRHAIDAPIDPEVLIVVTELVGDLRLQRETIDWGIAHAHLVSPARLRALARSADAAEDVERWIGTVARHARQVRWRSSRVALHDFVPSQASRPFDEVADADDAASTVLRMRALTGPTVRADVLRALHPVARGMRAPMRTADIAERTASSTPGVLAALREYQAAGFVTQLGSVKRSTYAPRFEHPVARAAWSIWQTTPYAPWHEVLQALPYALQLRRAAAARDGRLDLERLGAAMQTWDMQHARIHAFEHAAPLRRPSGASSEVAEVAGAAADRALREMARRVAAGD